VLSSVVYSFCPFLLKLITYFASIVRFFRYFVYFIYDFCSFLLSVGDFLLLSWVACLRERVSRYYSQLFLQYIQYRPLLHSTSIYLYEKDKVIAESALDPVRQNGGLLYTKLRDFGRIWIGDKLCQIFFLCHSKIYESLLEALNEEVVKPRGVFVIISFHCGISDITFCSS
jgi:hypothetical protein